MREQTGRKRMEKRANGKEEDGKERARRGKTGIRERCNERGDMELKGNANED